ncbi:MAG: glycosyltransferase family 2 protein [Cloacibacterium sp.]|nr:glycosyltransferase family 2 protein [Cloacibacterium sp.]
MEVAVFIKSFNRPHYLDRCISSVYQYVNGGFQIVVLDDGTPDKYLEKIKNKYPEIEIRKSKNHQKKQISVEENIKFGTPINGFQIPTEMWVDAVKQASDYFIMTEDDVWFTSDINLNQLISECKKFDIHLLKLGWLGNSSEDADLDLFPLSEKINATVPKGLFLSNEKVMEAFFYNKYRFFSILYKLGKVDHTTQRKYWVLNSILMGLYKKEYWLQIWKNMEGRVDEKRQIINATSYYRKHKNNPYFLAKTKSEVMRTTFQSSATGSYHQYGFDFEVNHFNHVLNEAWFLDKLDVLENFPQDFSEEYVLKILEDNSLKVSGLNWKKWAEKFREQYKNLGCDVE